MQSRLSIFLDTFFVSIIAFFISYATIHTFVKSNILCLIFSTIVFAVCVRLILPKSLKSLNNKYVKLSEKKHMEKCIFKLQTMENDEILRFFDKLLKKSYNVKLLENALIVDEKIFVCFNYLAPATDKRFVLDAYIKASKNSLHEIAIFTDNKNEEATTYAKNLPGVDIYFFDSSETYNLMKRHQTFPITPDENIKTSFFAGLKNMNLSKKKARSFLFTSFLLYFASLFIPFTSYYLIFAFISLILSVICFAMSTPKTETKESYLLIKKD